VTVEDEVDRKHYWPEIVHHSYPSQAFPSQQLEALRLG
jgi:hypothetical protein